MDSRKGKVCDWKGVLTEHCWVIQIVEDYLGSYEESWTGKPTVAM